MAVSDEIALQALDALVKTEPRSIQESEFKRYFLPLFSANTVSNGKVEINYWLAIAESPYLPVNVYNGRTFLFQVPPLLSSSDNVLQGLSGESVYEHIATAQLKYNVMPKLGEVHMRRWLTDRLGSKRIDIAVARQWNKIFERYGIAQIPLPSNVQPRNPSTASASPTAGSTTVEDEEL